MFFIKFLTGYSGYTDLVSNVEVATPGCRSSGTEVGQHDGRQHRAPAALHYHHAQLLIDSLRYDDLDTRYYY